MATVPQNMAWLEGMLDYRCVVIAEVLLYTKGTVEP